MDITEAEKNLLVFLRTRKPYEVVTVRHDKNAQVPYYLVHTENKLVISDTGIEEIIVKSK